MKESKHLMIFHCSVPVADDDSGPFPVAQFTVENSEPVWVYCRQTNHCQLGMVFAINPGNQFAAFQAAATGSALGSSSTSSASTSSSSVLQATSVPPFVPSTSSSFSSSQPTASLATTAPTSVTTLAPRNHLVVVGGPNKIFFSPSNISAQVGDTVTFQFQQKNHSATQSTFAEPCISLTETSLSGEVGFDSGL